MSELNKHSGSKYQKVIRAIPETGQSPILIDVYCVIEAFDVQRNPIAHAIKKLLMAGKRGGKDEIQDYEEAVDAIRRGIEQAVAEKADTADDFVEPLDWKRKEPPKQVPQPDRMVYVDKNGKLCDCDGNVYDPQPEFRTGPQGVKEQPEPKMSRFPVTFEDLLNSKRKTTPETRPTVGPQGGTGTPPKIENAKSKWLMYQCDLCQQRWKIETTIFGKPIDWESNNTPQKQGELPNEHV